MAGSGYTNWQTVQALNAPATSRMTDDLYARLAARAEAARGALAAVPDAQDEEAMDPVRRLYDRATQSLTASGSQPGIHALMAEGRGGGYSHGSGVLDSALVSGGGAGRLAQLRGQYAGLGGEVKARQTPTSPTVGPGVRDGGPQVTPDDIAREHLRKRGRERVDQVREYRGDLERNPDPRRKPYGQDPLYFERFGR